MRFKLSNSGGTPITVRDRATGQEARAEAAPDEPTYDDGYRQGWADQQQEASATILALQEQLEALGERLPKALQEVHEQLASQYCAAVTNLSFSIAESIVRHEISRATITPVVVRDALALVPPGDQPRLRLNPTEAQLFRDQPDVLPPGAPVPVPDASLQPGEAILDCQHGYLDATLATRFEQIRHTLDIALEASDDAQGA